MKYVPKGHQRRRVESAFRMTPCNDEQRERIEVIRINLKAMSQALISMCPNSRELNSALKILEEAFFWATMAIVRNEGRPDSDLGDRPRSF